jgi:hypothetical protein
LHGCTIFLTISIWWLHTWYIFLLYVTILIGNILYEMSKFKYHTTCSFMIGRSCRRVQLYPEKGCQSKSLCQSCGKLSGILSPSWLPHGKHWYIVIFSILIWHFIFSVGKMCSNRYICKYTYMKAHQISQCCTTVAVLAKNIGQRSKSSKIWPGLVKTYIYG